MARCAQLRVRIRTFALCVADGGEDKTFAFQAFFCVCVRACVLVFAAQKVPKKKKILLAN